MIPRTKGITRSGILLLIITLSLGARIPGDDKLNGQYQFVGLWKGPTGIGSVILIAPTWVITAAHVARPRADDPTRHIEVMFNSGSKSDVADVYLAPGADVALVHLKLPIKDVSPASLLDRTILPIDGTIEFTLAGHSGGLHVHPNRKARGEAKGHIRQIVSKEDPNPGRPGDSGGAWALNDSDTQSPVVFATIHGGGIANQLAPLRKWIDDNMKISGENAKWVVCKVPVATTRPD